MTRQNHLQVAGATATPAHLLAARGAVTTLRRCGHGPLPAGPIKEGARPAQVQMCPADGRLCRAARLP